ncbi:hypothetical protein C0Q70_08650 [Pomacea canaliculata]|uniref:Peptidoglycan recognition protein family domain-containing protein n=1 Tax=Pomacea canaliculata TaxID=400727 RepID=A0A2T7P7L5_POMCA|nr:hypothetical protein C0Q70_08650 [Pomacea canaliculata]
MAAVDIKSADTQLPARRILSTVWNLPEAKMRFIIALLLVHLHGQTEAAQCACATEGLNVRSAAGTSHGIVHVMQIGECATYLGQSSQADGYTWLHLSVAGQFLHCVYVYVYLYVCVCAAICVIGNFNNHVPNDAALATVKQLIQCGLANGKINPNYTLKGHRDVGSTDCPGTALYNLIHTWPHYASGTALYG